jgi:N-acetylneuraminic acid mutarotase
MIGRRRLGALAGALITLVFIGGTAPGVAASGLPTIGGSWSAVPPLPAAAAAMALTSGSDGRLYLFGFCEDTSCPQRHGAAANGEPVTYVYDPVAGAWQNGAGAPSSCSAAMAAASRPNGTIALAGCWTDMVHQRGFHVAIYHPASATWTMRRGHGPYADPIAGLAAANGDIYWFSERLRREGQAVFVAGHRVVVDHNGTYTRGALLGRHAPSDAAALGPDGRVYTFGGDRNCQPEFGPCAVPQVRAWRPSTDTWRKVTRMPTPRIRVTATTDASGRIFVMGGLAGDASVAYRKVEVYLPSTHSWARASPLARARMAALAAATPDGRVWLVGGYDAVYGEPLYDGEVFTPAGG